MRAGNDIWSETTRAVSDEWLRDGRLRIQQSYLSGGGDSEFELRMEAKLTEDPREN